MSMMRWLQSFLLLAVFVAPLGAQADALSVINDLRLRDCNRKSEPRAALARNDKLAVAAKHLAGELVLDEALQRAVYRADQSAVIRIGGVISDDSLRRVLAKGYCDTLGDAALKEVGIHQSDRGIALLFAAPFAPPSERDAAQVAAQVLQLVNSARVQPRRCGAKRFAAATPLALDDKLNRAALAHARDMAARDHASHQGSDGSAPGDRATKTGYAWANVAENIAGGQLSAEEVVAGWLSSPGHCANIMDSAYTHMGIAYAVNPKAQVGIYWAQVFGRPLTRR
jgi:uncharacterized protein YkwD